MQIIENWAEVQGQVMDLTSDDRSPDYVKAILQVTAVAPVAGFANLLGSAVGQLLTVRIPRAVAESRGVQPGATVASRVRKGGLHDALAHPDHLTVVSA